MWSIPLSVPNLSGNELKYVTKAVETSWVSTGGPYVNEFEANIASYVHSKGAVSCQNGTAGLHLSLILCGVGAGDEVIVPTLTFIAAVNPVRYLGAEPIFMDCDNSLTMDPEKLRVFCESECIFSDGRLKNKSTGRAIKAIIVVHVFGNLADMEQIMQIAEEYHLDVIEDATEALGTYYSSGGYSGKYAGTIAKIGVYSFNGNKLLTTGGGGMVVSEDEAILTRANHLSTKAKADELYFVHDEVGFNYRLTNLQAALGIAQLEQIEDFIARKRDNYLRYQEAFDEFPGLKLLRFRSDIRPNYWFYSLYIEDSFSVQRDRMIQRLQALGIQTRPIWGLIHQQKPYRNSQTFQIQTALEYWKHVVNIPCSSNLSPSDVDVVIAAIKNSA